MLLVLARFAGCLLHLFWPACSSSRSRSAFASGLESVFGFWSDAFHWFGLSFSFVYCNANISYTLLTHLPGIYFIAKYSGNVTKSLIYDSLPCWYAIKWNGFCKKNKYCITYCWFTKRWKGSFSRKFFFYKPSLVWFFLPKRLKKKRSNCELNELTEKQRK